MELAVEKSSADEQKHVQDVSNDYRLIYPFKHVDSEAQKTYVDRQKSVLTIKNFIDKHSDTDVFDAVMFSLSYIKDECGITYENGLFMDCMGFSGAASFYAIPFGFKSILGVEYSSNFFEYGAQVVFLDCTAASKDSMLDEGVLLQALFFPLCQRLQSGTYLIIVTLGTSLTTADCAALGFEEFTHVYSKPLIPLGKYRDSDRQRYPKMIWILRSKHFMGK